MSTDTLSNSISTGIVLTAAGSYASPFTVNSTGTINYYHSFEQPAVYSALKTPLILNYGEIKGTIFFKNSGTVVNASRSAKITSILTEGSLGVVLNSGTITSVDMGPSGLGDYGSVTNMSTGLMTSMVDARNVYNLGHMYGITAQFPLIINKGVISGYHGVHVFGTATVENYGTIVAGYSFDDNSVYAVGYGANTVTISNIGINSVMEGGQDGFSVGVASGDVGVIFNQGTMGGVALGNGGIFENLGIRANDGEVNSGRDTTIINQGTISNAVSFLGGTVENYGTIGGGVAMGDGVAAQDYAATLTNYGVISNTKAYGVYLKAGGATVINDGTIYGANGAIYLGPEGNNLIIAGAGAAFIGGFVAEGTNNTLQLAAGRGVIGGLGTNLSGLQSITIDTGANWTLSGGGRLSAAQTITDDGTLAVDGAFNNLGTILVDPAVIVFDSAVTGSGTINVGAGSDAIFYGSVASTQTIDLASTGTITLFDPAAFAAVVIGEGNISMCYLPGTRILSQSGERLVEELRRGDMVLTRFSGFQPIKWIGRQSYAARFLAPDRLPVRIAAGALGPNTPANALRVSPGHSMLVGGTLVLAKHLVNGITITQEQVTETVEYYAIELEGHDCVLANHAWGESFADGPGLRNQFHNVAEFKSLFPDYAEPTKLSLCAPRPESGPELEAALAPVLSRAPAVPGPLRGFIDICGPDKVEGWASDENNPDLPVALEVLAGEELLGTALACHHRADLAAAGLGRGHCMFSFALPLSASGPITVRRSRDGAFIAQTQDCAAA